MKIYVVGPIGKVGGGESLAKLVAALKNDGFDVIDPLGNKIDHSIDWRENVDEAKNLAASGEELIKNKVDILVADLSGPSDGRTIEQTVALKYNKPVLGYAPDPVSSPWRLVLTTKVFTNLNELIAELKRMGA